MTDSVEIREYLEKITAKSSISDNPNHRKKNRKAEKDNKAEKESKVEKDNKVYFLN